MKTKDTHKTTDEVRQATGQKTNLRVLVISSTLIVVAFAAIYLIYTMTQSGAA
ncbi:hypothetical protein [Devosia sp.]|uniref:hypothetical protein n=1 Tax=Devosia sp. TaxID=1871048 RepID=UPI003267A03D